MRGQQAIRWLAAAGFVVAAILPATGAAPDSQLCRAQLDLLMRGKKLTSDEAAVYDAQCACLERSEQADRPTDCAQ